MTTISKTSPHPTTTAEVKMSTDVHTSVLTTSHVASKITTAIPMTTKISQESSTTQFAEGSGETSSGDLDLELTSKLPEEVSTFVQEVETTSDDLAGEDLFTFSMTTVTASTRIITTQAGDFSSTTLVLTM